MRILLAWEDAHNGKHHSVTFHSPLVTGNMKSWLVYKDFEFLVCYMIRKGHLYLLYHYTGG